MTKFLSVIVLLLSMVAERNRFSYAKYPVEKMATAKINNEICGVWEDASDTDKGSYITIEPDADWIKEWTEKNPELAKTANKNEMPTETEIRNAFFISYHNYHGKNAFGGGRFVASKVGNAVFLGLPYAYLHFDMETAINSSVRGYVFYKLVSLTDKEMVLSRFADPELMACNSEQEVKAKITSHVNAASYYQPEEHYHKTGGYPFAAGVKH